MATKTFCSVCGTETEGEDLCPECEALSRPTAEFRERTASEHESSVEVELDEDGYIVGGPVTVRSGQTLIVKNPKTETIQ